MKTIMCEIKKKKRHKILDGINGRLDVEEKMISGLKDIAIKTTQN